MKRKPPMPVLLLAVCAALIALIPLGYLLLRVGQGLETALAEIARPRTIELLLNTFALVSSVSVSAILIGVLQAWLVVRTKLKFKALFGVVSILPLAIPSYVAALGWQSLFPGIAGFGISWLVLTLATSPYVFLAVSAALVRVDGATEEVARSLGASGLQVFRRVTWPAIRTSVTASGLLVALYTLAEFGAVAILRFDTFTRAIYNTYRSSFDRTAAAALALLLVVIALIILLAERRARGDFQTTDPRFSKRNQLELGIFTRIGYGLFAVFALLAIGIPVASLIRAMLIGNSKFDFGKFSEALVTSLWISLVAGLIIGLFALAVSILTVRFSSRFSKAIEFGVWLTHSLPGVVVGLALVFVGANLLPDLYQTVFMLLFAYLVLFLPNAVSVVSTPISQTPKEFDELANSLGKSTSQSLVRVVLPIAAPGIVAGIAMVSLTVLKELPATLLLRPNQLDTLATRLWQANELSAYSQAAPYALALIFLAGIPALALNLAVRKALREVGSR